MLDWTRNMGVKRWRTRTLDRTERTSNVREAKLIQKRKKIEYAQITNNKQKNTLENNKKAHKINMMIFKEFMRSNNKRVVLSFIHTNSCTFSYNHVSVF